LSGDIQQNESGVLKSQGEKYPACYGRSSIQILNITKSLNRKKDAFSRHVDNVFVVAQEKYFFHELVALFFALCPLY